MHYTNASHVRDNVLLDNGLESNQFNWDKVSRILTHNEDLEGIIESMLFTVAYTEKEIIGNNLGPNLKKTYQK